MTEGDPESFLDRARWLLSGMSVGDWRERADQDIAHAIALSPGAWEPWALRAEVAEAVGAQLQFCGEALRRGADLEVRMKRGQTLGWIDRFAEAEKDYCAILEVSPEHPWARRERVMVRAQLGNYTGAIEDLSVPTIGWGEHHVRELLGILRWIQGDFQAAHEAFSLPVRHVDSEERYDVWRHLCQIAHGVNGPMPAEGDRPCPAEWLNSGLACSGNQSCHATDGEGCTRPPISIWTVLAQMFRGRTEPEDLLRATRGTLEEADAWRPPVDIENARITEFFRPARFIWRSQVKFYVGLWYLSKGKTELAREALEDAARQDNSRSLERLAAIAQLARLDRHAGNLPAVVPLASPSWSPFSAVVAEFVGFNIAMPELNATPLGAALNLAGHGIGDGGLRRLLESPNTRFLTQLDLSANCISTAGMAAFRESSNIVNLAKLSLAGNPIGDIGLRTLLRSTALVSLTSIDLTDIGLTEIGATLLAEQRDVGLARIVLGEKPIDMPVWRRLAERYGEGLFACGAFIHPYKSPFDAEKLICLSYVPDNSDALQPLDLSVEAGLARRPATTMLFKLTDYVAYFLEHLAKASSLQRGPNFINQALGRMGEIEEQFAGSPQSIHKVAGADAFALIFAGLQPVSLDCEACRKSYDHPIIRGPRAGGVRLDQPFLCPAGHLLYRMPAT